MSLGDYICVIDMALAVGFVILTIQLVAGLYQKKLQGETVEMPTLYQDIFNQSIPSNQ